MFTLLRAHGVELRPLTKMLLGMLFSSLSFCFSALLQWQIDRSAVHSVYFLWVVPQYVLLTMGEILVSITGLEFAYAEAPASMKAIMTAIFFSTVSLGNIIVVVIALVQLQSRAAEFLLYALLMAVVAALFALLTRDYVYVADRHNEIEMGFISGAGNDDNAALLSAHPAPSASD